MKKHFRAIFIAGTLSVLLFGGSTPAHAETTTAGTLSPYTQQPSCPTFVDKKAQCTYPNGHKATCTDITTTANRFTGVSLVLSCTNPDKSTSKCTTLSTGSQIEGECKVTNADGTSGGKIVQGQGGLGGTAGVSTDSAGNQKEIAPAETGTSGKCNVANLDVCVRNIPGYLISGIGYFLLTISSIMLGIAGAVFNWVVIRTVFQFALYFGTSEGMLVAWGVLRDIANIGLLFGFIFMGIATILNTQGMEGYTAKKALPRLIIFAVLLNFSLFATQGIIDVANGFSSVFASYAATDCSAAVSSDKGGGDTNEKCSNEGISGMVLSAAGMNHILPSGEEAIGSLVKMAEQPYTYGTVLIILSLFVSITAVVLFAASVMLIVRVVVLSLLMVTSPIGFAGMVIPGLHGIATDWWKKLINQAFFAPIFLLMVFISLTLVKSLQKEQINISDALMGTGGNGLSVAGNMQVVVVFAVVIGFMIAALVVAQKMGAYGASFATKSAAAVTFGAHGFVARRTVGRASAAVAQNIRNSKFGETNLGRTFAGVADYGGKASFSTRNLVGGAAKGFGGVDMGKANKTAGHGYHGIEEKAIKERVDYGKSLKGPRKENDEEMVARTMREEADIENKKFDAQKQISEATTSRTASEASVTTAQENLTNTKHEVEALRLQVAQNPADTTLRAELDAQEATLIKDTQALNKAEEDLKKSTESLARANKNMETANSEKVNTARGEVSEQRRQINYAKTIEHQLGANISIPLTNKKFNLTLEGHANHDAAATIIRNAGKDKLAKAVDLIKESQADEAKSKEKDDHGGDHGGGASKAAKGGGGAHAAPAHDH